MRPRRGVPILELEPFNLRTFQPQTPVLPPWCSTSREVARGDSSVFPSSANCELPTVNWFALFAPRYLLYFLAIPHCPFCNPFVLITMQIAGGVGVSPGGAAVKASIDEDASPERAQRSEGSLCFPAAPWDSSPLFSAVNCDLWAVDSAKFFRMRSSTISTAKSFRMRSYEKSRL